MYFIIDIKRNKIKFIMKSILLKQVAEKKFYDIFMTYFNTFKYNKGLCFLTSYMLYLFIREYKPKKIIEMSPDRGWSSFIMINAIKDEKYNIEYFKSYDFKASIANEYVELFKNILNDKYHFIIGDAKKTLTINENVDLFFIDSDHSYSFAKWYKQYLKFAKYIFVDDINPSIEYQDKFRTPTSGNEKQNMENVHNGGEPYVIYDYLKENTYKISNKTVEYLGKFFGNNEIGFYNSIWEKSNNSEDIIWFSIENQILHKHIPYSYNSYKHCSNNSLLFKNS